MPRIDYNNALSDIPSRIRVAAIAKIKADGHRPTVERIASVAGKMFEAEKAEHPELHPKKICKSCGAGEDPDDDYECCCAAPDHAPKGFRGW